MEVCIETSTDNKQTQVMTFIYNAVCNGWTVNKRNDLYIFTKDHLNQEEVFRESYLQTFIDLNVMRPS
jgi:hypothetical protein